MSERQGVELWHSVPARSGLAQREFEPLETRQVLSGAMFHDMGEARYTPAIGPGLRAVTVIEFNQAPAAVQQGLDALAIADGLTPPAATATNPVFLNNINGKETYTLDISGTGTHTLLTVDQKGIAVTAPTRTTTTWAVLNSTASGGNVEAAAEISLLASALNLATPTDDTAVVVTTSSDQESTFSVTLDRADGRGRGRTLTVDVNGNSVGRLTAPFSAMPLAIQTGINANRPAGAAELEVTSTQAVDVKTVDGVTTYSTTFTSTGTRTTITIDATGQLVDLPTTTTTQFQNAPTAVQTELQALATTLGSTGTIASDATVSIYTEANGTQIYTVSVSTTGTDRHGRAHSSDVLISVDQEGNPTVLPSLRHGWAAELGPRTWIASVHDDFGLIGAGLGELGLGHWHDRWW